MADPSPCAGCLDANGGPCWDCYLDSTGTATYPETPTSGAIAPRLGDRYRIEPAEHPEGWQALQDADPPALYSPDGDGPREPTPGEDELREV